MKRLLGTLFAVALSTAVAGAQSYPGDLGLGTKLGIMQLNNSGQIGSVTLFNRAGGNKTAVVVQIDGAPNGRVEAVTIHRGSDCDNVNSTAAYRLSDLKSGRSRTIVDATGDRLLSGNYSLLVFSGNTANAHAVACGHLYR